MKARYTAQVGKVIRVARADGMRVVMARAGRKGLSALLPAASELPLFLEDVVLSPGALPELPSWRTVSRGESLVVDWVMTPPAPASGGHTTIFRVIEQLERQGHTCRISLYDRYRGDLGRHTSIIRKYWPSVRAETHDASTGLLPADATFATSWPTAHVVARRTRFGRRLYFVQDFEPDFHALGTERILAEATYSFGFKGVSAGTWLAQELWNRYRMSCVGFEFGCDTACYHYDNAGPRSGVVFYAKPDVPRRGFWLGALALRAFSERHPEQEIHIFGAPLPRLDFRHTDHGSLPPARLNELYNSCAAGLSLSLTNVSLVPWELLASGCTPVVNDAPHNRRVLDNPHVRWAPLAPLSLADGLSAAVQAPFNPRAGHERSVSVRSSSWSEAGLLVEQVVLQEVYGGHTAQGAVSEGQPASAVTLEADT